MNERPYVLGERLRELRLRKGITQDKVSELAQITPGYLGQIERGEKTPSIKALERLADALGVKFESLLSTPPSDKDKLIQLLVDTVFSMTPENINSVIKHAYVVKETAEKTYLNEAGKKRNKKKK